MNEQALNIVMAQINPTVGDVTGNTGKVVSYVSQAQVCYRADIVVFPELVITGYPPEDLLFREDFLDQVEFAVELLLDQLPPELYVVIGTPIRDQNKLFNAALVIHQGKVLCRYYKQKLPNYQVFDERRYFEPGGSYQPNGSGIFECNGVTLGLSVCEDIWHSETVSNAADFGVECLISINASPYHSGKEYQRIKHVSQLAKENGMVILYTNMVGGQDELVFDGASFAIASKGGLVARANAFKQQLHPIRIVRSEPYCVSSLDVPSLLVSGEIRPQLNTEASMYSALVQGLKDYVHKSGFNSVILGLSGGIDSALTLAIAVDALGEDKVEAVMMPFDYTSQMSMDDAQSQAHMLGVKYRVLPIHQPFSGFMVELEGEPEFSHGDSVINVTEQNLQARCRGVMLMALSNRKGSLVLTTGNSQQQWTPTLRTMILQLTALKAFYIIRLSACR